MHERRRILVLESPEQATQMAADLVKTILCEAADRHELGYLALSGGTTPHGLYQQLALAATSGEVPWAKIEVFFSDERDVPHDHVESNYRMAQRTLLDHVPIEPSRVHPMPADAEDLQAAAANYEQTIRRIVPCEQGLPRLDLVLLGMGGDGHTASLFPASAALEETRRLVASHFVPVLGRNRMTFTLPLINAARNVLMLITGADKAEAVRGLLEQQPPQPMRLPAAGVSPSQGLLMLVMDAAAARLCKEC